MDFALRLALLYAALFGAIGVQLPFLPVWFAAKGLDEGAIGAVLATATAARVASVPLAARAADRFGRLKVAIVAAAVACALGLTALGAAGEPATILVLYPLAAAAGAATLPLTETYALRGLAERGRAYGPVRLWGSAAFIVGALGAGILLDRIAPSHIIWILVTVYWGAVLAAVALRPVSPGTAAEGRTARAGLLLRSPPLLAVMAASGLVQGSHALLYGFGTLQWSAAGLSGFAIAVLWSLGVLAEIVLFAFSARLPAALGPPVLLAAGAAGAVLRWAAMALDPPAAILPVLQGLHALSFGATHLGAVQLVARAAPAGLAATAQGFLATANGAAMAATMALSGVLLASVGLAAYAAMAALAAAGGVAAYLAWRWGAR